MAGGWDGCGRLHLHLRVAPREFRRHAASCVPCLLACATSTKSCFSRQLRALIQDLCYGRLKLDNHLLGRPLDYLTLITAIKIEGASSVELTGGHDDALRAATEECDGRRAPASPEQLEEEERDNAYDKAGFLSFMEYGGFDLRKVRY